MLRLDPGEGRIRTARSFRVWEGGGEYNVARGAAALLRAAHRRGDRAGRQRGRSAASRTSSCRAASTRRCPLGAVRRHRPHRPQRPELHRARLRRPRRDRRRPTAATPQSASWRPATSTGTTCSASWACGGLHTGGIFAALSPTTAEVAEEAMTAARAPRRRSSPTTSTTVPACGSAIGGPDAAQAVNRRLAPLVDVMLGNEEDFTACLGFAVPGADEHLDRLELANFRG